jgi:phosphate transport system permease protein
MTTLASPPPPGGDFADERPLDLRTQPGRGDRIFDALLLASTNTALLILGGGIVVFLCIFGVPTAVKSGFGLFTDLSWSPDTGHYGAMPFLAGSVAIAVIAVVVATPVSLATALMINEYAPRWLKSPLTWVIDLLATVPSIVYGFWGLAVVSPGWGGPARWLGTHFGFIPPMRNPTPNPTPDQWGHSILIVGIICAVTVIPIITSISREVMAQAPRDVCEAALGLGGTRWGMVTDVVFPFSKNGILGAALLGFGRGLGETMIPVILLSSHSILTSATNGPNGMNTIAKKITEDFVNSSHTGQDGLILLALILFVATLGIASFARAIVSRTGRAS